MSRPLYRNAAQEPPSRDARGHAGLWFDKFYNRWPIEESTVKLEATSPSRDKNPKLEWIQTLAGANTIGARDLIEETVFRLMRLIESRNGRATVFATESRFVTGLGRSHPVENGFAWHPTLGTPYLPASSVKGLVRSWAKAEGVAPTEQQRLLGGPGTAGTMCFLDAVPVAPVHLEADIMTPHYAGWSDDDPPGDWCSPIPIPFLVTAAETRFLFGIIPCRTVAARDIETVSKWLRCALAYAGGGAKTAIGYGRFRDDDKQTHQWNESVRSEALRYREERERQEAMKSPEGRWRLEIKDKSEEEILDLVRIHLEKEPLQDAEERKAFARAVHATDLVDGWRRGKPRERATKVGKKKLKERAQLLDRTAALDYL